MADNDTILERVRKLLGMAEGAKTEGEADAFNAKAETLLQKYGIDRALAEAKAEVRSNPITRRFRLGETYGPDQARLWHVITKYNRCLSIRISTHRYDDVGNAKRAYDVKVTGYQQDVEICELLFTSLHLQVASRLQHVKGGFGVHGRTARCSYFAGFINSVGKRLRAEQSEAIVTAEAESTGTELVLVDRAALVKEAYKAENPESRTLYARREVSYSHYKAGQDLGNKANLHNRQEAPASSRQALG